jgi:transcription elongation GreA/GreB family factor
VIGGLSSKVDRASAAALSVRAGLGTRVTIRRGVLLSNVTIVAEAEADRAHGRIASTGPLACALVGARRGDVVEIEEGGRTEHVLVVAVERAED